jgi:hypothetical protein
MGSDPMAKKSFRVTLSPRGVCSRTPHPRPFRRDSHGQISTHVYILQCSKVRPWCIDYHAIHPILPHRLLMLFCNYPHTSSNLFVSFMAPITQRSRPMGYAAEYLALTSFRLHMCISPLMSVCRILYHIFPRPWGTTSTSSSGTDPANPPSFGDRPPSTCGDSPLHRPSASWGQTPCTTSFLHPSNHFHPFITALTSPRTPLGQTSSTP